MRHYRIASSVIALILFTSLTQAADWPQWLGENRDSIWREQGIIRSIPDSGLKVKWRAKVGLGYSGPAVAQGRVFLTDYIKTEGDIQNSPSGRTKLEGTERILCLDAETGRVIWKHEYACPYNISYASGPRCTPTVDGGQVYCLGAEGNLKCLKVEDGTVVWEKNVNKEYKTESPLWGHSAHPLVVGNTLFCIVGGEGSVAVAFDKRTGKELWRKLSSISAGYCPPTMIRHGGINQLLIWHPTAINSLNPETGDVYWTQPLQPGYEMSITVPRLSGDLLFASGIQNVGAAFKLSVKNGKPAAELAWKGKANTAVYCAIGAPIIRDGIIYGSDCGSGQLMGVRLSDGERLWETRKPTSNTDRRASHGNAFVVLNGDRYFLFSETGDLIIADLNEKEYRELGRFHVLDPTNECFGRPVVWSHPAFANKAMYARNDKELVCVDLSK